jgi:hypothetical protein
MPPVNGISLIGNDTLVINGRSLLNFAGPLSAKFEFPDDVTTVQLGKNGNAVIALKNSGKRMNGEVNLLIGSDDDQYFNALLSAYLADPPSFALMPITFTKRSGDGQQNVTNITYIGTGGIFMKIPMVQDQAEGESEQGTTKWMFAWPQVIRAIL